MNIQNRAEQMTVLPAEAFLLLRIGCDGWKGDRGSGCRSRPPFTACTGSKRASADGRKSGRAEAKVIKSRGANGKASVTFTLDPGVGAQTAAVCGEWNDWSADVDVMRRDAEGGFSLTVDLEAGRAYRFR